MNTNTFNRELVKKISSLEKQVEKLERREVSNSWCLIENWTAADSVTNKHLFSNISQNFKQLKILGYARATNTTTSANRILYLRMNGVTGATYDWLRMLYFVTSTTSLEVIAGTYSFVGNAPHDSDLANTLLSFEITFPSYSNLTTPCYFGKAQSKIANTTTNIFFYEFYGTERTVATITSIELGFYASATTYFTIGNQLTLYGLK